jgi:hypothetical protein
MRRVRIQAFAYLDKQLHRLGILEQSGSAQAGSLQASVFRVRSRRELLRPKQTRYDTKERDDGWSAKLAPRSHQPLWRRSSTDSGSIYCIRLIMESLGNVTKLFSACLSAVPSAVPLH